MFEMAPHRFLFYDVELNDDTANDDDDDDEDDDDSEDGYDLETEPRIEWINHRLEKLVMRKLEEKRFETL